jgi:Low molecular weight phosphotyrosine protein phosphatase
MERKASILFFSTGDATRSRMAALLRRVTDELETASTAVQSVAADQLAGEVLSEIGVDLTKQPAKSVEQSFREHFAVVVTLSDDTKERSRFGRLRGIWCIGMCLIQRRQRDRSKTNARRFGGRGMKFTGEPWNWSKRCGRRYKKRRARQRPEVREFICGRSARSQPSGVPSPRERRRRRNEYPECGAGTRRGWRSA